MNVLHWFEVENLWDILPEFRTHIFLLLIGKKVEVSLRLFDIFQRKWFSFSYGEVGALDRPIGASDEIDRVSKFDNSLSFGAKQKSLGQIFFLL